MASSWRSLLKEKIHSVLSRDKEIKEQFNYWKMTIDKRSIRGESVPFTVYYQETRK